jgi:hypothetical protein
MPTFENGWICRECWTANREQDRRCYRCHKEPARRAIPEPATFSTPDGKPNEERKKVSSLIGSPAAQVSAVPDPEPVAAAPKPATPAIPLSERLRGLVFVRWAQTAIAALAGAVGRIVSVGRAVGHAPGAGARLVSDGVKGARREAGSRARSVMSHRRAWLSAAWAVSALSCALLFSAALHAPFAASLLVVLSVAIFSGLTAAITTNASERTAPAAGHVTAMHPAADHGLAYVPPPEHPAQPAELLGGRPAR